jgi:hypothetical protein
VLSQLSAHLVFADESGFLLIPYVAKTWPPQGGGKARLARMTAEERTRQRETIGYGALGQEGRSP